MTTLFWSAGGVGYETAQNPNPISHRATAKLATCANRNGGQNETSASKITTVAESKSLNHNARSSGLCRKINGLRASQHPSITSTIRAHIVSSLQATRATSSASRDARPQNMFQTTFEFRVLAHTRFKYSKVDQTSSYARATRSREITAVTIQRKHQAPTTVPCITTSTALTIPKGITSSPKSNTNQGRYCQRRVDPASPKTRSPR